MTIDWWAEVRLALTTFLSEHGLFAAFVLLLIEEAGVPIPVPGDFLMLLLGVQARQGQVALWQVLLAMEGATVIGATLLYALSARAGRGLVYRYGRFIRLTPERLDRVERWLQRHGLVAVFVCRLVPGLRIVTAVACGVFSVSPWKFLPAMSLGGLLYIGAYVAAGYLFGSPVLSFLERLHLPLGTLGSFAILVLIVVWTARARQALRSRSSMVPEELTRRQLMRAGAFAGGLATVAATLLVNLLVNLAGNVVFQAPGTLVERTAARLAFALARDIEPLALFAAAPAYVAVGILWGALYGGWIEDRLPFPDWANGFVFSLLPLATSLLVAMPLLGMGFLGFAASGPIAAVGETLRHAAYGSTLGLLYPVMLSRHLVRILPHSPDDLSKDGDCVQAAPAAATRR